MKKIIIIMLVLMIGGMGIFSTACGDKEQNNDSSGQKDGKKTVAEKEPAKESSMQEIFDAVNASFDEFGTVTMGMKIDDQVLQDVFRIEPTQTEDYAGEMSFSQDNPDVLLCVKAKDDTLNDIVNAMQQKLTDLKTQFAEQTDTAAYARVKNGQVYIKGNCVFLIVVGVLKEDNGEGPYDFSQDVEQVEKVIDGFDQ